MDSAISLCFFCARSFVYQDVWMNRWHPIIDYLLDERLKNGFLYDSEEFNAELFLIHRQIHNHIWGRWGASLFDVIMQRLFTVNFLICRSTYYVDICNTYCIEEKPWSYSCMMTAHFTASGHRTVTNPMPKRSSGRPSVWMMSTNSASVASRRTSVWVPSKNSWPGSSAAGRGVRLSRI